MSHEHAHPHAHPHDHAHGHAHGHAHRHAEPRPRDDSVATSVLMSGALPRLAAALAALVLLWAAVAWALVDLSA